MCTIRHGNPIRHGHQTLILAGDFNGKVGTRFNDDVVGRFGDPDTNDSGNRLVNTCKQYNMKINKTFFQHKQIHQYTWTRPSLGQKSIIDFIITKQSIQEKIKNVTVKRGANCGSDHFMVVSEMIYPYMNKNTNNKYDTTEAETEQVTLSYPRYKVNLLGDDSIKYLYQRRIKHHLQKEQPKHTIEEEHTQITQAVHQAMQEAVGYKEQIKNQPIWMTDKLEEKISEKKLNYNNWLGIQQMKIG
ncbi:craniofacial development protein 2-like [Sitophilus oryzae]|uniref:Craniofacial development protein 2-like n=1 Tax=Sitophilus oryzae TaxID=7048 RepID=A0A6J2Y2B5_SITOR|nr:craniofacial development protein 2-like [Sitophilus oryzae]